MITTTYFHGEIEHETIIPHHYHVAGRQLCQKLTKFTNEQSQSRSSQYQCIYLIRWKSTEIYSSYCPESKIRMWKSTEIYSSYCPESKIRMYCGQITLSKMDEICPLAFQSRSQYQCTYQIWWKSIAIYSRYCPKSKIGMYCWQITMSKMDEIWPLAIPMQISTISMHIPSWWKSSSDMYYPEMKIRTCCRYITVKNWWNLPWAILNQISSISMLIPSLVKSYRYVLKLSSRNENVDVSLADNSVKKFTKFAH